MRVLLPAILVWGVLGFLSRPAAAFIVEYDYVGMPFEESNGPPSVTNLSGDFLIDSSKLSLPTTLDDDISGLIKSFSFTDGNQTLTKSNAPFFTFKATFDDSGQLTGPWDIEIGDQLSGPGMSIVLLRSNVCNDTSLGPHSYVATIECGPDVDNRGRWSGPNALGAPPPVPEPPSFTLLAAGIGLFGLAWRIGAPECRRRQSPLL
jgi:hypothetical protein